MVTDMPVASVRIVPDPPTPIQWLSLEEIGQRHGWYVNDPGDVIACSGGNGVVLTFNSVYQRITLYNPISPMANRTIRFRSLPNRPTITIQ